MEIVLSFCAPERAIVSNFDNARAASFPDGFVRFARASSANRSSSA
jgi:hypothetical protein